MTDLTLVRSVILPRQVALDAHVYLRNCGLQGGEAFALWVGAAQGEVFRVQQTLIPYQASVRLPSGICVIVSGEELHRINVWLYERALTIVAQLHSHPTDAFHSDLDDMFPIATTAGSLSIVVPNFAAEPFSLACCAVFRLDETKGWFRLPAPDVWKLITIVE